jgi:MYND finger
MPVCSYCESDSAGKKCGACKLVWYCNRECQVAHYKVHKRECTKGRGKNGDGTHAHVRLSVTLREAYMNESQVSCWRTLSHLTRDRCPNRAYAAGRSAPARTGLEMDDEDLVRLKQDFDKICDKYNFRSEEMSSKLADFITAPGSEQQETTAMAEKFGMTMEDTNKFMMWIQIGTRFKHEVIDRNAELMAQRRV